MSIRLLMRAAIRRVLFIAALLATLSSALPFALPAAADAGTPATAVADAPAVEDSATYLPLIMQRHVPTDPLNVQVVLDPGHRTQQVVPRSGGAVSVTAADGAKFTLTIPDGSLWVTQTVTMTVVSALPGLPLSGGPRAVVHLEPAGLMLRQPALLTITAAAALPPEREAFIAYDADGKNLRLHPFRGELDHPERVTLPVAHFSGYGIVEGQPEGLLGYSPAERYAQLTQQMGALAVAERKREREGLPPDPQWKQKLEAIVRAMYIEAVQPGLQAAFQTLCKGRAGQHAVDDAISMAADWAEMLPWFGMEQTFAAESQAVADDLRSALVVCWNDATQPCLDRKNPTQMQRADAIAEQARLAGLPGSFFDVSKVPDCLACEWARAVRDWVGSVSFAYTNSSSRTESGTTTTANTNTSAHMGFMLPTAAPWGGRVRWSGPGTGNGSMNDKEVSTTAYGSHTQTWVGSGSLLEPSYAKMNIDPALCTFSIEFHPFIRTIYTNDGGTSPPRVDVTGVPYLFELKIPENALGRELSGAADLRVEVNGASENTYTHYLHGGFAGWEVEYVKGKGNMGTTPVTWTLRPAWCWGDP